MRERTRLKFSSKQHYLGPPTSSWRNPLVGGPMGTLSL
jgi:hypothetical protein